MHTLQTVVLFGKNQLYNKHFLPADWAEVTEIQDEVVEAFVIGSHAQIMSRVEILPLEAFRIYDPGTNKPLWIIVGVPTGKVSDLAEVQRGRRKIQEFLEQNFKVISKLDVMATEGLVSDWKVESCPTT